MFYSIFTLSHKNLKLICLAALSLCIFTVESKADHLGRLEKAEPFFTEKAFLEKELELDIGIDNSDDDHSLELGLELDWVFFERLELGAEVPYVFLFPDGESSTSAFSDIGLSATALICCTTPYTPFYLSLRGGIDLPTGDEDKGIGGTGEWGFSLNTSYFFPVEDISLWGIQLQLAYAQQLKFSDEQKSLANTLDINKTHSKDIIWNAAFSQEYFNGRFAPIFEFLGTSTVDAMQSDDEGTILELGFGFWVSPFSDTSPFNAINLGAAAKFPVTERKETTSSFLFVISYGFD